MYLREANIISPIINKLTYIRKIIYLFYIKFLYERAEGIVFVSKGSMLDFDKHISSKKIVKTHIPNPVFENKSLDTNCDIHNFLKDKKFILAVGRIHEQKNFSTLLDIFFELRKINTNLLLVICGDGDELKQKLIEKAKRLNISESIFFPGFQKDLSFYYKNAKALCMTSLYEGFPSTLIEAMSYYLPIVAFKCNSGPDEILENVEKSLTDYNDISCFIKYVDEKIKNKYVNKTEYDEVLKKYDKNLILQQYLNFFNNNE